jgi:ABC-type transport system substrate-binding protein
MAKFLSDSPENWGRFKDPVVDELFHQQKVERDETKRAQLVKDMQKRIIEKNWEILGLWWTRIEVRSAKIRNYEPQPSHWLNRRLEDVWLAEK